MANYNIVDEPKLIKDLHQEFFRLINFYSNTKRSSLFIKYYNLVTEISPVDKNNITYDRYGKVKAYWDLYELVPAFNISPIQNTTGSAQDLKGQMIEGSTSLTVYTLKNPRIDDLVVFYDPIKSEEVFRVSNIRLQLNSLYSDPELTWYELDLETAPIKYEHVGNLLKRNHYIYDVATEKNYLYSDYKNYINKLENINSYLSEFKDFYSPELDLYHYNLKVPRVVNELLYLLKTNYNDKFNRVFESYYSPFGFWDKYGVLEQEISNILIETNTSFDVINLTSGATETYLWTDDSDTSVGLDRLFYLSKKIKSLL